MPPRLHLPVLARLAGPFAVAALVPASPVSAQVTVSGTFTVEGKTSTWSTAYVSRRENANVKDDYYLVILLATSPIPEADREDERLAALASAGKVQALQVIWHEGHDGVTTTPFHKAASDSGEPTAGGAVIDLTRYDGQRIEVQVKSKMLGQNWQFNARLKGPVIAGPPIDVEPKEVAAPTTTASSGTDLTSRKRQVGRLGYEWNAEGFMQAVKEPKREAVELFLKGGMSPDTKDDGGIHALMFASMYCGQKEAYGPVIDLLIAARANVNVKDGNGSTPLIWAAQSCSPQVVAALVKAGADVNAKAKGGATPLMMAEVMKRTEVVALLKKAGAK